MNRALVVSSVVITALLAASVPARADAFCDTLKAIVKSADEFTAFESLNTRELDANDQMQASVTLAGMPCEVEPETGKTFFACALDTPTGGAQQTALTKQASACLAAPATKQAASMGDVVSVIELKQGRNVTIAIRWSQSFNRFSINTIAVDK